MSFMSWAPASDIAIFAGALNLDYVSSLEHDVRLVRESKGTPKHVNIYGYVYNIDTDELSLVLEDAGPSPA